MSNLLVNLSLLLPKPTGISIYAANVFPYLKSLDPTLLTTQEYTNFNCYSVPDNLTPECGSKGHLRRLIWTQFELPDIYQNLKASLLFSPVPEAPIYSKCRSVVMVHDLIPLRFPKRNSPLTPYFRYYIPQVLQQAEHIICNSHSTAKDITDFWGISAKKITPIHLGYDQNNFRVLTSSSPFINKVSIPLQPPIIEGFITPQPPLIKGGREEKLESDSPYFLYLGRHDPYKNLYRLIEAFANLRHCQDYQLWLAGPTDERYTPKLQAQAEELGIKDRVKFLNYVPYEQLPIIINQAIALVFPSLWEGFGFPVLEAMACGTPVITSNLSSLPEVAGDAALLINPYQVKEITAAMQMIAEDGELRSQLSDLSLQQASKFSWQKTGEATREILVNC